MNTLRAMDLFVRLVELGSFTRVAEQSGLSKSMISKEISRLEAQLGARLLHRTTRHLQLTQVGEGYLGRAKEILAKLDEAQGFVQSHQQRPRGKLKINLPMTLGLTDLSRMFADFMRDFPEIDLDIHLGDESVDLVAEGFDLGFRAASQALDSTYVGRPVAHFEYHICASPAYLAAHPPILQPQDLADHNCFEYRYFRTKNHWPVGEGIKISGSLKANNVLFMMEAVKQGLGIGFFPDFACRQALAAGQVQSVLADYSKPSLTLYALYPARHYVPPKVVQCMDYMIDWFAKGASQ